MPVVGFITASPSTKNLAVRAARKQEIISSEWTCRSTTVRPPTKNSPPLRGKSSGRTTERRRRRERGGFRKGGQWKFQLTRRPRSDTTRRCAARMIATQGFGWRVHSARSVGKGCVQETIFARSTRRSNPTSSFFGAMRSIELRCAIAHRRISMISGLVLAKHPEWTETSRRQIFIGVKTLRISLALALKAA